MNNLIKEARSMPVNEAVPVISVSPITLSAPNRGANLVVRVSAPVTGYNLPIILLSHGHGPSLYIPSQDGYGPIVNFWAAHGFVVIQPSHLNSKVNGLPPNGPDGPMYWRSRVDDMKRIIDQLADIEAAVPQLQGRIDPNQIAVAGHSFGGFTASLLLGAKLDDASGSGQQSFIEPRIKAGLVMAAPGNGGSDLAPSIAEQFSFMSPDFSHMHTPALVVVGDEDFSPHLTNRDADWHADAYRLSPSGKSLLTLHGGKHGLGGIAGFDAKETDDEDPDRLAIVQCLTYAYLSTVFFPSNSAWTDVCQALKQYANGKARVEQK